MNPTVIEAGARGIYAHEPLTWGGYGDTYETIAAADRESLRELAESAIDAAMVALAPDIRAAVGRIKRASRSVGIDMEVKAHSYAAVDGEDREAAAIRDLFALLGIPEGER